MSGKGKSAILHAAGLIGATAVLFFHPGAMDMDRIKSNLLLLIVLPLTLLASGPRRLSRYAADPLPASLGFAALLTVALLFRGLSSACLFTEGLFVTAGILMLVLLARAASEEADQRPRVIPGWLLAAGALAALLGLLQSAGVEWFYLYNPGREAVSTLGNTNELAEVMALLIPLNLALLLGPWKIASSLFVLPVLVAGLWVSGGRGGLLAALAGAGVVLFFHFRSGEERLTRRRYGVLILAVCVGLIAGLVLGSPLSFKKIETEESVFSAGYPTNKARIEIWKSTVRLIEDHTVLGVGAGQFRVTFPPYRNPEEARMPGLMGAETEVRDPHNEYLWSTAEGGVVGGILFLLFLATALRGSMFWAGTLAAFAVLALFRSPLHNPAAAVILFLSLARSRPVAQARWPRLEQAMALPLLVLLAAGSWVRAGPGLASDWIAASTAMEDRLGPRELERFQRAADLDPWNIDIINFVGQTAARLAISPADRDKRYWIEAQERLKRVLELNPHHPDALKTLSRIRALAGDMKSASMMLEHHHRLMGVEEPPEETLARWLGEQGGHKKAAEALLDASGGDPESILDRAEALFRKGEARTAAVYVDQFLEKHPFHGDALYLLGRCLRAQGDGGEDEVFRRMHLAYALDWVEKGDLKKAGRSVRSSLRYGEGSGEAALLGAVIRAEEGEDFIRPERDVGNKAFLEKLRTLNLKEDYFFHLQDD
jgi:O-antigen ligase/tetratricopeptide (TPR) repeat protein